MDSIISYVLILPIMLLSSGVHEFAHAYSAYLLGDDTARAEGRMTMNPFAHIDPLGLFFMIVGRIGWSKPVPVNSYNFDNPKLGTAIVSAAGPFSNLILVALSAGIIKLLFLFEPSFYTQLAVDFFTLAIYVNTSLMLFNLIPIPPLDGSNILESFLPRQWQNSWSSLSQYAPFILVAFVLPFSPLFVIFGNFWYNLLSSVVGVVGSIIGVAL